MRLFNSLSKKLEEFVPLHEGKVGIYACGPTVYDYPHIGHGRKYVNDDILKRALEWLGYKVTHVQNITDVGHLVSDADEGEDKLEKGARKYGKTVWEVAEEYTEYFLKEMDSLNIIRPDVQCKATDHIKEQIELVKTLMEKGYAYDTEEAVYFDVTKFADYGKMFNQSLEEKKTGAREEVETETSKKHPADFALWFKRVGKYADHVMHWESPWGDGFPGWHIECSAMSMKYLGEQIDIHTGGEDHMSIHHPNEIAQSEAATEKKPFVKYWFHTTFLMVDGKKMSKSLGNVYKVADMAARGFSPIALRYYFLSAHYRKQMNFTWQGLEAASNAYEKLKKEFVQLPEGGVEKTSEGEAYEAKFLEAIEDDLNMPVVLAVVWEVMKSETLAPAEKRMLVESFDEVMGLGLALEKTEEKEEAPKEVWQMAEERAALKKDKKYEEADAKRLAIEEAGWKLIDTSEGWKLEKL